MKIEIDISTRNDNSYSTLITERLEITTETMPNLASLVQSMTESVVTRTKELNKEKEAPEEIPPVRSPSPIDDIPF